MHKLETLRASFLAAAMRYRIVGSILAYREMAYWYEAFLYALHQRHDLEGSLKHYA